MSLKMEKCYLNTDIEMADLYFKLFEGCVKFKKEKDKKIDCNEFYNRFEMYSNKIVRIKQEKIN